MLGLHAVNPDESIIASVAWNLWTEGRFGTDLLAGAIPGIEHHLYWTMPLYYPLLAGWLGLWGFSLLAVRALPAVLALGVLALLYADGRQVRVRAAWLASALILCDLFFDYAGSIGRMDMLAILLTTAAVVLTRSPRPRRRHALGAGLCAAGALLTHPLGAAAGVAVLVPAVLGDRRSIRWLVLGALPPLLLYALYVGAAPADFAAQMSLQLARKADIPHSLPGNLWRQLGFYGVWWPAAVAMWLGGLAGLLLDWRRHLAWLAALAALWPAVAYFGEIAYPAYLAPATAVGLAALARRLPGGAWVAAALVLARLAPVAWDPPPAGGIDPGYADYCARIEPYLGRDHDVILGLLPDPWFGLRHRQDLRFRHAPPVGLPTPIVFAYVFAADVTVVGGYDPPGFVPVIQNWERIALRGQKLYVLEHGRMVDVDTVPAATE